DGIDAVVYLDYYGHLHEISKSGTTWYDNDFSTLPGLNAPLGSTHDDFFQPRAYVRSDGISAIVYRGQNNRIYEVSSNWGANPPWVVADLKYLATGAPYVYAGSPMPYVRSDNRNAIVYTASDHHIHEILSGPS